MSRVLRCLGLSIAAVCRPPAAHVIDVIDHAGRRRRALTRTRPGR